MKEKHSLIAICLLLACTVVASGARDEVFNERESNAVGGADRHGFPLYWMSLSGGGPKSIEVPLRFSTAPGKQLGGLFGGHWWCPLLESCVVQKAEDVVSMWTPGGEVVELLALPADAQKFRSRSGKWEAEQKGNDLHVHNKAGDRILFHKGRIHSYSNDQGETITWEYVNSKLQKVLGGGRGNGNVLVETLYEEKGGRLKGLVFPGGHNVAFQYGPLPVVAVDPLGKNVLITQMVPTLTGVKMGERSFSADIELDQASKTLALKNTGSGLDLVDEAGHVVRELSWSAVSGLLEADDQGVYEAVAKEGSPRPGISLRTKTGEIHSYEYDPKSGVATITRGSTITRRYYILTDGPNFGKIRKFDEVDPATSKIQWTSSFDYTSDGKLLRQNIRDKYVVKYSTTGGGGQLTAIQDVKREEVPFLARLFVPSEQQTVNAGSTILFGPLPTK